jgi:hypothetical protein
MAHVIDEDGLWIAGNDTLVQTGDMVDRGEPVPLVIFGNNHAHTGTQGTDTIALYRLFQNLRGQARASGGELYSILGSQYTSLVSAQAERM